jgi:hypothetical protein
MPVQVLVDSMLANTLYKKDGEKNPILLYNNDIFETVEVLNSNK